MRIPRAYVDLPLADGAVVTLPDGAATHLSRVLRLRDGDALRLFNGDGHDHDAVLLVAGRTLQARVTARRAVEVEPPLPLTLAQGIARGEKMDWVLQKATELGVTAFAPVVTERTEVKLDAERGGKRLAHWRGVVVAACEQSGRARVPAVEPPESLARWAAARPRDGVRLVLDPRADTGPRDLALAPGTPVTLVAGPEGGLSPGDLATLRAAGFTGLRLGPRILRTETAGLAAIAALLALYGDLG